MAIRPNDYIVGNGEIVAIITMEWCGNVYIAPIMANNGTFGRVRRYPSRSHDGLEVESTLCLCDADCAIGRVVELEDRGCAFLSLIY